MTIIIVHLNQGVRLITINREIQGRRIKGMEMALVLHEKASRTALQTSSVSHTHTLLVQTHNMTTVKEIFFSVLISK